MPKRKSVSLIEVLVGTVLLALVFGGLLTAFVAVRNYIKRSNARLVAANFSRRILIDLSDEVSETNWDSGPLSEGWVRDYPAITIDSLTYRDNADNYRVEGVPGRDYRKVTAKIKYPKD